ncbi:3-keto-5-aminohexanoate cleavage protein [Mycobacterium aquaticum]|uniref:3-keto-5-aminohexanoate cleavage protein n=1 Tax=Mycobacterium aquaticum TaxID=1927124 RepID=A0A1X0A8D2_9MYCO|nr:3-keto-5-aminohexanoate cleavage protein [Mycobacterium aquaticum]ORA26320.1 3-keto-5-aminohexanoate cleavage protein [Mycobacterium aquaticum]
MSDTVHWDRVARGLERDQYRMIWRPYGLPEITDPEHSLFHDGEIQPAWDIPQKIVVQSAITGAFFTRHANPNQPQTTAEILEAARQCVHAGASAIHLHVRDDRGYNTLSVERFEDVVLPLREEFPGLSIDGCYVCALAGEWEQMKIALDRKILDAVPINTAAVYNGDALFAKPAPMILEKTRLVLEAGAAPIIAVYADADVDNAKRYLFASGLLKAGQIWCILPALPGCSPMNNPLQMIDGLQRVTRAIRDVDPEAKMLVCSAGRASSYLVTMAAMMGLHIRVGMEDTVWRWPHRQEKIESNLQAFETARDVVTLLGRDVATPAEYREIMGLACVTA